jgi:hypothetical protein
VHECESVQECAECQVQGCYSTALSMPLALASG